MEYIFFLGEKKIPREPLLEKFNTFEIIIFKKWTKNLKSYLMIDFVYGKFMKK